MSASSTDQTTKNVRRVQARSQRPSGGPIWLGPLLGGGFGVCVLVTVGLIIAAQPFKQEAIQSPLVVVTVTPTPIIPTATPRPTESVPPTALPAPSATPEGLFVSGEALVTGTNSALRLRSDPGLQSTTLKTIGDGVRLRILEGPREADGLRWWRLQDDSDGAQGWAAETYLTPAAGP